MSVTTCACKEDWRPGAGLYRRQKLEEKSTLTSGVGQNSSLLSEFMTLPTNSSLAGFGSVRPDSFTVDSLLGLASMRCGCLVTFTHQLSQLHKSPRTARHSWLGRCSAQQQLVGRGSRSVPVPRRIFCAWCPAATVMAAAGDSASSDPKNFKYMQLWVSKDGETHIQECKMKNFDLQRYSSELQFVKSDFGGPPMKMVFTQLSAGLKQPLHSCPAVQFVITLSGSWYIETTDGNRYEFQPGEVLFQDNTKDSPAAKQPQHYSGAVGDQPCQQFVIQFARAPEIDNPEAF